MITEAERRALMAKRRPMTEEELREAREVLCKHVAPETSVAYHFTLLLLEVERVQAVAALRAAPAAPETPAPEGEPPECKTCGNYGCMGDVNPVERAQCKTFQVRPPTTPPDYRPPHTEYLLPSTLARLTDPETLRRALERGPPAAAPAKEDAR
jgi:hypothetical protein